MFSACTAALEPKKYKKYNAGTVGTRHFCLPGGVVGSGFGNFIEFAGPPMKQKTILLHDQFKLVVVQAD